MPSDAIVVRVLTRSGVLRISAPPFSTLLQLKQQIEARSKIPVDLQKLFIFGSTLLSANESTLAELGIVHGGVVDVRSEVPGEIAAATETSKELPSVETQRSSSSTNSRNLFSDEYYLSDSKSSQREQSVSRGDSSSAVPPTSASSSVSGSSGTHQNSTKKPVCSKEPIFKSFDQFLYEKSYNSVDLPLNKSYNAVRLQSNKAIKVPPSVTLQHQPYRHVDHLELMNVEEVQSFVKYWRDDLEMLAQRGGWMYGYYIEDPHYPMGIRAVCEAIYEPPQFSDDLKVTLLHDNEISSVDRIAERLGLERIGWIFTHLPRDELLTSEEVVRLARVQLSHIKYGHYSSYPVCNFIACTISPDTSAGTGEPVINAYMISDLGMAMVRDDLILPDSDPSRILLKEPEKESLLPQVLESGKEATSFDCDWLIVRINEAAPKKVRSIFHYNHFPRENRGSPTNPGALKDYFSKFRQGKKTWHRFANFHLLIYIAHLLDVESSLAICDCIINKEEVDTDFEEVLLSI